MAIPWAIESGSRAWGFPSPDSDYDCRFVFVRSESAYLTPWPERDVIETPLDPVLDVNGWDLIKAVRLIVKGNAVLLEWLQSPYVYCGDEDFCNELRALAIEVVDRDAVGRHHTHVGLAQLDRHLAGSEIPLKRLFYALRPAVTVRWLEQHPGESVPPMDLPSLMATTDQTSVIRRLVDELVAHKSQTRELGTGPAPAQLLAYASAALSRGEELFADREPSDATGNRRRAADFFRAAVRRWGPG